MEILILKENIKKLEKEIIRLEKRKLRIEKQIREFEKKHIDLISEKNNLRSYKK